jgi:DNA polymerase (family 10)
MMVATIPGVLTYHFRLDIEFVKEEEFYSCLLYFTGSKDFNIAMRSRAKKMGMILNQHGLFDLKTRCRYVTKKEEDIFDKLNLVFVPPKDR